MKNLSLIIILIIANISIYAKDANQQSNNSVSQKKLSLEKLSVDHQEKLKDNESENNTLSDKQFEKRVKLFKIHRHLGLTTLALMTATYLTAREGDKDPNNRGASNAHKYLGIASGITYFSAAAIAFSAPELENDDKETRVKWHERLALIHFPAMIMTTILGFIADKQFKDGKKTSGIVAMKPAFAHIAFYSLLAAGITMTFDF